MPIRLGEPTLVLTNWADGPSLGPLAHEWKAHPPDLVYLSKTNFLK